MDGGGDLEGPRRREDVTVREKFFLKAFSVWSESARIEETNSWLIATPKSSAGCRNSCAMLSIGFDSAGICPVINNGNAIA